MPWVENSPTAFTFGITTPTSNVRVRPVALGTIPLLQHPNSRIFNRAFLSSWPTFPQTLTTLTPHPFQNVEITTFPKTIK